MIYKQAKGEATMAYKYCTATNWGKNFSLTREKQFHLSGHPGEVWVVGDNLYGDQWISKVAGAIKTKEEAQAMLLLRSKRRKLHTMHCQLKSKVKSRPVVYNLP